MNKLFIILAVATVLAACNKDVLTQAEVDERIITDYIAENNLDATATGSGLYYVIDSVGTGDQPNANSNVRVAYVGYLTNGAIFDQSESEGITFNLQGVIDGWTEGIPYFREGGSGILLIPSELGYGTQQVGTIPRSSVLIFDIELLEIVD